MKLPIQRPPIDVNADIAQFLSAVMAYEELKPWFHSNFIHLQANEESHNRAAFLTFPRDKFNLPYSFVSRISKKLVKELQLDIVDFFKTCIDNNIYIHTLVNNRYIPCHHWYNERDIIHDIFIYGYDDENCTFDIGGFFSQPPKYEYDKLCSYKEMQQAYEKCKLICGRRDNIIELYQIPAECSYSYPLNLDFIVENLKVYLESTDVFSIYSRMNASISKETYGMKIYNVMQTYLRQLYNGEEKLYYKPIRTLYNHKTCMLLRAKYIVEKYGNSNNKASDFITIFKKNEENALKLLNILIKYKITSNKELIIRAQKVLSTIEQQEKKAIEELIEYIEGINYEAPKFGTFYNYLPEE